MNGDRARKPPGYVRVGLGFPLPGPAGVLCKCQNLKPNERERAALVQSLTCHFGGRPIRRAARALSAGNHGTFVHVRSPLQQRHEIPDGEDVIFHKSLQILHGSDFRVYGMVQQPRAKGG